MRCQSSAELVKELKARIEVLAGALQEIYNLPPHLGDVPNEILPDSQERVIGCLTVSLDVTDQKHAAEKLRQSEARLQAAVDLVKLGCYSWNPRTNELQWDETIKAMWGLPACTR